MKKIFCDECNKEINALVKITNDCDYGVQSGINGFRYLEPQYESGRELIRIRWIDRCIDCVMHIHQLKKPVTD